MAILFSDNTYRADKIFAALTTVMPHADLRQFPRVGNAADIQYAIIWRPAAASLIGLPNLRAIFTVSAGVDGIIYDHTLPPDVPIVRSVDPDLTRGMVEYAVYHTLRYHRHFHHYDADQKTRTWKQRPQIVARDRVVGIMGLGEMGRNIATSLSAMGFAVRGWSRGPKKIPNVTCFAGNDALTAFLSGVDIVINVLPLTPDTSGILNARLFKALPQGAFLINAGRGPHLVLPDLLAALDSGHIAHATLDVFDTEPLPEASALWAHPKIAITPHIASITNFAAVGQNILKYITDFERGRPLPHLVDRTRGY
jgi:glyoxylate/hydroxypyruvate reductase A